MPIPKNYPLEAFSPKFPDLLLRAARGEDITIPCKSASEAYRLQHMLHNYRIRARETFGDAAPEKWRPLFTAVVGLQKDATGKKSIVHIYSRHDEFKELFANIKPNPNDTIPPDREDPLAEFDVPTPSAKPEGSGT